MTKSRGGVNTRCEGRNIVYRFSKENGFKIIEEACGQEMVEVGEVIVPILVPIDKDEQTGIGFSSVEEGIRHLKQCKSCKSIKIV